MALFEKKEPAHDFALLFIYWLYLEKKEPAPSLQPYFEAPDLDLFDIFDFA